MVCYVRSEMGCFLGDSQKTDWIPHTRNVGPAGMRAGAAAVVVAGAGRWTMLDNRRSVRDRVPCVQQVRQTLPQTLRREKKKPKPREKIEDEMMMWMLGANEGPRI